MVCYPMVVRNDNGSCCPGIGEQSGVPHLPSSHVCSRCIGWLSSSQCRCRTSRLRWRSRNIDSHLVSVPLILSSAQIYANVRRSMAVTSAMSAELIAVSSIWTYDIYQTYINPKAQGKRLIYMSHASCVVYSLVIAGFSTGLYYAGISMGYLYLMMGVIISGAVLPAALTLLWDRQSWAAATFSPPLALCCSLIAWLVTAKTNCGSLDVTCTGSNYPMLAGNVCALLAPFVFCPLFTFIFPTGKYDWVSMNQLSKGDDTELIAAAHMDAELVPGQLSHTAMQDEEEQKQLQRSAKIARSLTVVLTLALLILWPMPMYGSGYIFSKKFFTGWVVVGILWLFISSFCVGLYPLYEGRHTMKRTFVCIWKDITGRGGPVTHGRATMAETVEAEEKFDKKRAEAGKTGAESD